MRTILLFWTLLLAGLQASAQPSFNGFFINNEGDTTAVFFPDFKEWEINPTQIKVRTASGQDRVLSPENSREVTIEGYDTYRSRRFTRLLNPYVFDHNNYNNLLPTDTTEEVHGFLLFLARGRGISLYKYADKKRANFFIDNGDSLVELKHKIFMNNNYSQVIEDNRFRNQLWVAFLKNSENNNALKARLERLMYKEDQLEAFVKASGGKPEKKKIQYPTEYMIMAGAALNTYDVEGEEFPSAGSTGSCKPTMSPVLGIAFYDYSQRNFGRNFFTLQAWWYRFENSAPFTYFSTTSKVTYRSNVINLGLGMGRNFVQTSTLSVYAAAVPHIVYLPDSRQQRTYPAKDVKQALFKYNLALQAGARLSRHLGFWMRWELRPIDTQNYELNDNNHRTLQLGVDWRLKRQR